ncbi:MAG: hypothetical protein ABUT20_50145, partial [Bacteroidota bacterium]
MANGNLITRFGLFPYYAFAILIFFLTHGYSENVGLVPFKDIVVFFIVANIFIVALFFFFRKRLKSSLKAGIVTSLLLLFYFFYGAFQDAMKKTGFLAGLSRYRILPLLMLAIVCICYFIVEKSSKKLERITLYFNILFSILIITDVATITAKSVTQKNNIVIADRKELVNCGNCSKPDVYLIVMDEYWGNNALKNYFHYNNESFTSFLKENGFFVAANPSSNYASTPLSLASTFDMDYIPWLKGRTNIVAEDYAMAARTISTSAALKNFKSLGYDIRNFSIFDIMDQPSKFNFGILPVKLRLITAKTMSGAMEKDLLWNLRVFAAPHIHWLANYFKNQFKEGNDYEINETLSETKSQSTRPKFVYTHLMMPHAPYIFDSTGKENENIFLART